MDTTHLRQEFTAKAPLFEQLREEALYALEEALKRTNIKYHSLPSRVKQLESFLNKVRGKEIRQPFSEIYDIVGLRVVCLYLSDVDRIGKVIRKTFKVQSEDNKIEGAEVSSFGYMSVHFIVTMLEEYKGPRYDSITSMPFEIQVRTIAMDAWANVSHHLNYKSDRDVPDELRKDFYALSGLFYVADRHFEMFYGESKQSREFLVKLFEQERDFDETATQALNADSLSAYLHAKFPDRAHGNANEVSDLLNSLLRSGHATIGEVDRQIEAGRAAFTEYERECAPQDTQGKFIDVGVVRVTLEIVNQAFLLENRRRFNADDEDLETEVEIADVTYQKYRTLVHPRLLK